LALGTGHWGLKDAHQPRDLQSAIDQIRTRWGARSVRVGR
jgi:hypothetical protein